MRKMTAFTIKNSQEQEEDLFNRKEIKKNINFDILCECMANIQIYFCSRSLEVATELNVYSKIFFLFNAISRFSVRISNQIRFFN